MIIPFQATARAQASQPEGHTAEIRSLRTIEAEPPDVGQTKGEAAMALLGHEVEHLVRKAVFLAREHGLHREVYLLFMTAVRTVRGNLGEAT